MWILNAEPPRLGWNFNPNYFPRKFRYKKDALEVKNIVEKNGGRNVTLVKEGEAHGQASNS